MSLPTPDMATEAAAAGHYPANRFNQRERKLLESVQAYVDAANAAQDVTISALSGLVPTTGLMTSLLGASSAYEILGSSGITNSVGATTVLGDIGRITGSITGFPPGIVTGTTHNNDASAIAAQAAFASAKSTLEARGYFQDLSGQGLGGRLLFPGVYKFSAAAAMTGTLTLDANGNPNAQFIFQIGSTLTTAASAVIVLQNGARADNIVWCTGTSITLGATNTFMGQLLAGSTVVLGSGSSVVGRLYSGTAVTLDTNVLNHSS